MIDKPEHDFRKDTFAKNMFDKTYLAEMNYLMSMNRVTPDPEYVFEKPVVFLMGLPRSGVTLAHQILAHCLNIGYIDQVIARFWEAPHYGAIVSRQVFGDTKDDTFQNIYGRSVHPRGPHEFHYFWESYFGIEEEDLHCFGLRAGEGRWGRLHPVLDGISNGSKKEALLFRNVYAINFYEDILRNLPNAIFVFISRPNPDVAVSIYRARLAFYGEEGLNNWWSMRCRDYPELVSKGYKEQIIQQVHQLDIEHSLALNTLPNDRFVFVTYESIARYPNMFVQHVQKKIRMKSGVLIDFDCPLNKPFPVNQYAHSDLSRVEKYLHGSFH